MGCGVFPVVLLFGLCANGDFGRVKPGLTFDGMHNWVGVEAANRAGVPASNFPLTDDEMLLRDLAYPLIEPPYDRHRWYSILNEYGLSRLAEIEWPAYDDKSYAAALFAKYYDSPVARYNKLNEDIRNDVVRLPPFCEVAVRVADMDRKRDKSLRVVSALTADEAANASTRMAENDLTVRWVKRTLVNRVDAYLYTLERLVIASPSPSAIGVEHSLTLLKVRIAENCAAGPRRFFPASNRLVTK